MERRSTGGGKEQWRREEGEKDGKEGRKKGSDGRKVVGWRTGRMFGGGRRERRDWRDGKVEADGGRSREWWIRGTAWAEVTSYTFPSWQPLLPFKEFFFLQSLKKQCGDRLYCYQMQTIKAQAVLVYQFYLWLWDKRLSELPVQNRSQGHLMLRANTGIKQIVYMKHLYPGVVHTICQKW